ncbi:hypothetical protein B8W72_23505 [Pseudomonas putida]|uniref:Sialidase domain-containing protein n=1 Tax=Pseudomonas putida TaxID=303 RepID=A0A1Y3KMP4_PSEPU|nr:sialidase family protein [Pseudomonas putida]OUM27129.1 hypothetical protein B8W72_23505 [Pseudomonas putida]
MDGLPVNEVPREASHASAIIMDGKELARFDKELSHWILNVEPRKIEDFSPASADHADSRKSPSARRLPAADSDFLYLAKDDSLTPSSGTNIRQSVTNADVVSKFDQRPTRVFVDAPARIERNTDDPFYRLANRAYQATATIARTGPNRYWTAWRADNTHAAEGPGNFAVLAYSENGGDSVKEYGYLTYSPSHPGNQIVDPMLWTDPKGRLWLFYGVSGNNKLYDGVGGAWAVICYDPNAESPEWGEPFRLSYYGDPRRPVKIENKWYMALDGWRFSAEYPPIYMGHVGPHIYELDWEGQKIKHVSQLPPNNNGQYSGFFETEFVQRSDGSVLALLRSLSSNSQMQYSVSRDLMRTWTPWQDYTVTAPSSSSRAWLGRTPSGLLLLCWNNDLVRGTLTVGLSDDDGATYRYKKIIEPDPSIQISYPVVSFGDDGEILVIYDNGRDSHKQIRLAKVNEYEIISGKSMPSVKIVSDPANP